MSITAVLAIGLAFLMLVVGLRLTWGDFLNLWRQPKAVAIGLFTEIVLLPLTAIAISSALQLSPQMSLGLLVVSAAPGGITSNYMNLLARADAALSSTLTLATSLLAGITIPAILMLGHAPMTTGAGAMVGIVIPTVAVSAVPLVIGMVLRRLFPAAVVRWTPIVDKLATLVFFIIVAMAFIQNGPAMIDHAGEAGPAAILLNLSAIAVAFAMGSLARLPARQTLAIGIECGLHNIAMAMFVAANVLQDQTLLIPALVYAVVMNVTALILVAIGRNRSAAVAQPI